MDTNIYQYRKKHKRCKFCKYYNKYLRDIGMTYYTFTNCKLKDKHVNESNIFSSIFCKYYEVKQD
jgi:glutaredoxin